MYHTRISSIILLHTCSCVQVVTPAPGGPADRAGLQAGDIIVDIDGKPTNGASLYDAGDMLQGAEGSEVSTAGLLCCAVLCCAVLCCAVLCCAVLCCAVLCCAVLCYA